MAEKKKSGFGKKVLLLLVMAVLGYVAGACICYFTGATGEFVDALTTDYAFIGLGAGAVLGLVFAFMGKSKKSGNVSGKTTGKTAEGIEMDLSFNAKLLTKQDDIRSQFGVISTTWSQLPSVKKTGIVFQNSLINGKYVVNMKDEFHAMVIGATASGKSHLSIIPTIRVLGHSGEKPDMVISDPKGELFQLTSNILKEEGYRVYKYDLRDPFTSSRWNPMGHAYEVYQEALNLKNNIKKCTNGATPERSGYRRIPGEKYGKEWYGFKGMAYPDLDQLKKAVENLSNQGATSLVFDVRGTSAGTIEYAATTLDVLVPVANEGSGALATALAKDGTEKQTFTADADSVSMPMLVLVNGETAGPAELFACDLRDYGKAQLVGQKTAGNGTMQQAFPLSEGGAIVLTMAVIKPYVSESYNQVGLTPDVEVALSDEKQTILPLLSQAEDDQFQKAYTMLTGETGEE